MSDTSASAPTHFIRRRIKEDLRAGHCSEVVTRFPPEPNGYLHIGHAKAALLNMQMALEHRGCFRLRFDDTNPVSENAEFEAAIIRDLHWLGCTWEEPPRHASDYFSQLYEFARQLISRGDAYVCDLDMAAIRDARGTFTETGQDSPHRERPVEQNLRLFEEMRAGKYPDGHYVLRAKIDMASPNPQMRDPVLYRIRHVSHHRSGTQWPIYPTYDFAHCLSDAVEGVSHSLCTLEFENHRPLYDWLIAHCEISKAPQQIEFARLNLSATVMSKRHLKNLVETQRVHGWDDPRLPTLSAMRRRGYPPEALREFCARIGVSRSDNRIDMQQLEVCVREILERQAARGMCVLRPLRVRLHGLSAEQQQRSLQLPVHPDRPQEEQRSLRLGEEIFIEREDYAEKAPKGWRRLSPGQAVRLRGACVIHCERVEYDFEGQPECLHCICDSKSFGVKPPYKIGGVIHWVSALDAQPAVVRLYSPLFQESEPLLEDGNLAIPASDSLEELEGCLIENSLSELKEGAVRQFERLGYFCVDPDSRPGCRVFNRTVSLRDSWSKQRKAPAGTSS